MMIPLRRLLLGSWAALLGGCATQRPAPARHLAVADSGLVIDRATVVAFWLSGTDTLGVAARGSAREQFQRSNAMVARYLSDTDIALVPTLQDTVVIRLSSGIRRVVMLTGLDYPYGYVLIEPGFAEEIHTGIDAEQDLQAAIDDYFGLEDDAPTPRHRIAQRGESCQRFCLTTSHAGVKVPHLPAGT